MNFIAVNTTTPVPKIDKIQYDEVRKAFYNVIEYMHGKPRNKFASYLEELQQLTGKQLEGINGTPVRVGCYLSRWSGPFERDNDFNHFKALDAHEYPGHDHTIRFAHGDFIPRNMLVDGTGQITADLDWEWAGWFPEYWDVVRIFIDMPSKK
ncbi:hypothetical protein ACJ73_09034 [Blastomyces percursus]|uniref:Aminoglycoside phosphotransferase domain-containing protein n=1 Tax=Blastomyces percursus TaxID=1658174 RepID=A0A1J9PG52_9EURO|nr:hypothetical protein ACJ73_09034 [Blastomyces percursus]